MTKRIILTLIFFYFLLPSEVFASDWPQDAGNAQRTGYTHEEPVEPWTLKWSFNGPDANGGTGGHFYDAGRSSSSSVLWEGRTIANQKSVFVPALDQGLYALDLATGTQKWRRAEGRFESTPAYDSATNSVFAVTKTGTVYKINADTGAISNSYNSGQTITKSVLVVNNAVFVVTQSGNLIKLSTANLSVQFTYSAGAKITTPPAYSASTNAIIFASQDLYIHSVDNSSGQRKWRVKPTTLSPSQAYTFEGYWPVVADQAGIVFVRMNIGNNGLWSGPGTGNKWPTTNAEIRQYLASKPEYKNLFALRLDSGADAFVPAVGPGGTEGLVNDSFFIMTGPVPVVKDIAGKQVAYSHFRNGQTNSNYDGRWDSHIGEMVLDNNTLSGYQAGDLRFVNFPNSQTHITDEQNALSMAGDTLFHSHWGASESMKITDRSAGKGSSFSNPIGASAHPAVIRRISGGGTRNSSHWTTSGLTLFDDGRYWSGPGFWVYWNVLDPPTPDRNAYSEGILPRYTYVANGYIVVEGNGGDLMVFKHSGSVGPNPTPGPSSPPSPKPGDADGDGDVDGVDYTRWLNNYNTQKTGPVNGDFNNNGVVDGVDYTVWLNNYGS